MKDDGRRSFPHSPPDKSQQEGNLMKEPQVTQILQELAEQEVPASLDLWPAIQARLQPQRHPSWWTRIVPATRLGWAFLALALFLALGAAAYAVAPILSRVSQMEAGLQHIEQSKLGQELNLSQTLNGITVTLQWVYADANRLVVGFMVNGPEDLPGNHALSPARVTLTDAAGTVFPGLVGYGVTGQSDILKVSLPSGEGAYLLTFDAAPIEGEPAELDLQLVMEVETYVVPTPVPSTPDVYEDMGPLEPVVPMATAGPFTFDFSVPFIPGRTVEVQQTVETAEVAVRLERVVVTPSETRAILCFDPPDGGSKEWTLITALDTGDGQELSGGVCSQLSGTSGEICYRDIYLDALTGRSGTWTLTVTELVGEDINQLESQILRQADSAAVSVDAVDAAKFQTRLAGPWVFHFVVP
jgi:hypothetical protein